jgi:hypothetical protein
MPVWFWLAFIALTALVVVQGFAFLEVIRQIGQLREQFHAQDGYTDLADSFVAGQAIPNVLLVTGSSLAETPANVVAGRGITTLVFLHPGCLTCHSLARQLKPIVGLQPKDVKIAAIVEGRSLEEARRFMLGNGLLPEHTYLDDGGALAQALNLKVKPAVVIARDKVAVSAASVRTADQVDQFVHDRLEAFAKVSIGEPVAASDGRVRR